MKKLDLLAIGEVMAELRRSPSGFAVGFAGDTFNTAVYCKRVLGQNHSVGYFSRVGSDPLSEDLVGMAEQEGLDAAHIAKDREKLIGIYAVSTDATGERSFSYWRENSAARQLFSHDEAVNALPPARVTYLSGISLAILSASARRKLMDHLSSLSTSGQSLIAFDSNYRPRLWESQAVARQVMGEMWEIADIALPSIDDEMELFSDATEEAVIDRFSRKSWAACAIKRGVKGPVSPNLAPDAIPTFLPATKVIDTTAAGDSFNAGYLAALLAESDEATCLAGGHQLASRVVGYPGAIIALSDW
jgi:2-dehydro-3-deoxygluconokinase